MRYRNIENRNTVEKKDIDKKRWRREDGNLLMNFLDTNYWSWLKYLEESAATSRFLSTLVSIVIWSLRAQGFVAVWLNIMFKFTREFTWESAYIFRSAVAIWKEARSREKTKIDRRKNRLILRRINSFTIIYDVEWYNITKYGKI